ncbi:protein TolQ [Brenneria izadpanahii]|uniref:Protein TolQ n=1 Tax=Brenneria izadpanahii TaxID=2722756 RepID=A0ABX7UZE4_9GAMM|nr:protein TolQ [Brenneria izadpanahii]QTF09992.1 protein TolQ [Brenneria izadpanahii]
MAIDNSMTLGGLIGNASPLVQCVMAILLLGSLISWYLIVAHGRVLRSSEKDIVAFRRRFRQDGDPASLQRDIQQNTARDAGARHIFSAAWQEYRQLTEAPGVSPEAVSSGVEHSLHVAIAEQEERLTNGLAMLATIGSVSPYIGLFGTVWGIMNAFIGLSHVQQATLNTVAPGIAEALIATAIGLFAAIPAVIFYNRFTARTQTLVNRYYSFANELQGYLHRRLHLSARASVSQSA